MDEPLAKKMRYQNLGCSGLRVSQLGFGSWMSFGTKIDVNKAYELMKYAFQNGINFFDNAETYGDGLSEQTMGQCIQRGIDEGVWQRSDLIVTTKLFFGTRPGPNTRGLSRKHIVEGLQDSLKRFNLEYVDIVYCHRPDPFTPIEETVRAINYVIEQGWAFYWGTSEWSAAELTEAFRVADKLNLIPPIVEQPQYNMFDRTRVEVEYVPLTKHGLGLTTYSPTASGILTGKYSGGKFSGDSRLGEKGNEWLKDAKLKGKEWQIELTDKLKPIAQSVGCNQAQLAIGWCLCNAHVPCVLIGATNMHQLKENIETIKFLPKMTPNVMKQIEEVLKNKPEDTEIHKGAKDFRKFPVAA